MTSVFTDSRRKFFGATNKREIIEALDIDPNAFRYDIISGGEDYSTKRYYNRGLISTIESFVKSGSGDIVEEYEVGNSAVFYATGSIARLGTTSGYKATIPSTPNAYMNADKRYMSIQDAINAGGLVIKGDFSPVNPVDIYSLKLNEASRANITLTYKSAGYLMQESVMYGWNSESGKSEWTTSYFQKDPVAVVTTDGKNAVDFVGIDTTPLATLSEWGTVRSEVKDLSESGHEWSVTSTGEPFLNEIKSSDLRNNYSEVTLQTSYELEPGEYAIGISPDNFATSIYVSYNGINGPAHGMRPTAYELKIEFTRPEPLIYGEDVTGKAYFKSADRDLITGVLSKIGQSSALVTDIARSYRDQAEAMYKYYWSTTTYESYRGTEAGYQSALAQYGKGGDMVTNHVRDKFLFVNNAWISTASMNAIKDKIISGAAEYIESLHNRKKPVIVSNHIQDPDSTVYAIDIAPSSINKKLRSSFISELQQLVSSGDIRQFLYPGDGIGKEKAFHIVFDI